MSQLDQDRLRATLRDSYTDIRILLIHPMASGRGAQDALRVARPDFIQDIRCWRNDKAVLAVKCGKATAENPYFSFRLINGEVGDQIKVRWVDNLGKKGEVKTSVK